nr:MAG TPA: hypothetical protein [Caudoviricetes sp.]
MADSYIIPHHKNTTRRTRRNSKTPHLNHILSISLG